MAGFSPLSESFEQLPDGPEGPPEAPSTPKQARKTKSKAAKPAPKDRQQSTRDRQHLPARPATNGVPSGQGRGRPPSSRMVRKLGLLEFALVRHCRPEARDNELAIGRESWIRSASS
jgi:hypothetical protein